MSGAVMGGALPTLQEVSVLHLTPFSQREGICSHAHELCAWIVGAGVPVLPRVASCVSRWDRKVHFQRTHSPHHISERSKAA